MITIKFFTTLRLLLKIQELELDMVDTCSVGRVLVRIQDAVLKKTNIHFLDKLLDEQAGIKRGTIILLNGRNVLDMEGLDAMVKDEDTIALFPPGGGG